MTDKTEEMLAAVRESVLETIEQLGIEAVKSLSWFPSNRSEQPQ